MTFNIYNIDNTSYFIILHCTKLTDLSYHHKYIIQTSNCHNEFNLYKFELLVESKDRNQFYLSPTEQYIIYAFAPIIYLTAIFNIVFFLRGKNRRQPPADILLFICFFGILRISSYLTSAIYDGMYPPSIGSQVPASFDSVCEGTGFINILCQISGFVYNVIFCIYYVIKIKNPFKSWIKQNNQLHIACLILIFGSSLAFYLTDLTGISILGVCGYKIGPGIIYLDFALTISYFSVMVISSIFFIKYLKSISRSDQENKMYFRFYFKYLIISSIVHLLVLVSLVTVTIKCLLDSSDDAFQFFSIVCNLSRLSNPVMVFVVMLNHPQAKFSSVIQLFSRRFLSQKTHSAPPEEDSTFYTDLLSTKRTSMVIELSSLNRKNLAEIDYLSKIKDKNKACLINTILGCISLQENQGEEAVQKEKSGERESTVLHKDSIRFQDFRLSGGEFGQEEIYGWNFTERYQFQLTDQVVREYKQIFSKKLPTINLKFISFSSSIFKSLQQSQKISNVSASLLPSLNQQNILQNLQTDGGRSGQFFFFNYDNTFIIKTISAGQLKVLLDRIQPYYNYLQKNPFSLLVKILGLYKVINPETGEEISFMLMGNILRDLPKRYVIRSYDMKGSSHQRRVLNDQQMRGQVQTSKTLKDVDFHVLEKQVHISREDSRTLKQVIEQDTIFLYSQGLIDYSLILLKVDYERLLRQTSFKGKGIKMYKSTKEEGVVYIFGIIDYLQTWNLRKKGQKWYKSIFSKTQGISSQDPKFYAQRFMKSLINTILP